MNNSPAIPEANPDKYTELWRGKRHGGELVIVQSKSDMSKCFAILKILGEEEIFFKISLEDYLFLSPTEIGVLVINFIDNAYMQICIEQKNKFMDSYGDHDDNRVKYSGAKALH